VERAELSPQLRKPPCHLSLAKFRQVASNLLCRVIQVLSFFNQLFNSSNSFRETIVLKVFFLKKQIEDWRRRNRGKEKSLCGAQAEPPNS
jgi:hypothetical protein